MKKPTKDQMKKVAGLALTAAAFIPAVRVASTAGKVVKVAAKPAQKAVSRLKDGTTVQHFKLPGAKHTTKVKDVTTKTTGRVLNARRPGLKMR